MSALGSTSHSNCFTPEIQAPLPLGCGPNSVQMCHCRK